MIWQKYAPGNGTASSKEMAALVFPCFSFLWCPSTFWEAVAEHMRGRLWRNLSDPMAQIIIVEVNPGPDNCRCSLCKAISAHFSVQDMLYKLRVLLWKELLKMHITWAKTRRNDLWSSLRQWCHTEAKPPRPPKRHCLKNADLQVDVVVSKFLLLPFVR